MKNSSYLLSRKSNRKVKGKCLPLKEKIYLALKAELILKICRIFMEKKTLVN